MAYNLRVNGCIVEYYTEEGNIEDACSYAENKGINCILRAYPDGILQIKDMIKNERNVDFANNELAYIQKVKEENSSSDEENTSR